jgi:uncharacterized integral membrane protein (TIGR00698 family)
LARFAHKFFSTEENLVPDGVEPPKRFRSIAAAGAGCWAILPGILLCAVVTAVSLGAQLVEQATFGHPYVEALVFAILLGMGIRSFWTPGPRWRAGIAFSAKQLLEVAVMLLGASISFATMMASGPILLSSIVCIVAGSIAVSYGISRSLRLPVRLSILVACGNSICGNSAIAAIAPVIGANSDDIASSISFTAILGVVMVLGLPLLIPAVGLSANQYGILAGMTVYAVPQVLAATIPAGLVSTQIGTLVKLIRVLTLGPVVLAFSLFARSLRRDGATGAEARPLNLFTLVPWFIVGFLVLAAMRSLAIVPDQAIGPLTKVATFLTVVSMAALGLGVDLRVLSRVGARVTVAVTMSLLVLLATSLGLVQFFH